MGQILAYKFIMEEILVLRRHLLRLSANFLLILRP